MITLQSTIVQVERNCPNIIKIWYILSRAEKEILSLSVRFNPGQYILFHSWLCSALTLYHLKKIEGRSSLVSAAIEVLPVFLLCDWPNAVAKLVFFFS